MEPKRGFSRLTGREVEVIDMVGGQNQDGRGRHLTRTDRYLHNLPGFDTLANAIRRLYRRRRS